MLERDVILSKINIIKNCLKTIDDVLKGNPEKINDHFTENVVTLNLQRSIQACIDMAQVLISLHNLGIPNSYSMSFYLLAKQGLISSQTAEKMKKMVGFRNISVHDYQEVNPDILKNIIIHHLGDFEEFFMQIIKGMPSDSEE